MGKRYHLHTAMLAAVHFRIRDSTIHKNHGIILNPLLPPSTVENASLHACIHHVKTSRGSFFLLQNNDIVSYVRRPSFGSE